MDALPAIVPFFGATVISLFCGLTCMSRRLNALQRRLETLEQVRAPPPTYPQPPPILPTPPITQQQPQPWMYQSYPTPSAPAMGNRYV